MPEAALLKLGGRFDSTWQSATDRPVCEAFGANEVVKDSRILLRTFLASRIALHVVSTEARGRGLTGGDRPETMPPTSYTLMLPTPLLGSTVRGLTGVGII